MTTATDTAPTPADTGFNIQFRTSDQERSRRDQFVDLMRANPMPANETLPNLGLFLNRQTLSRILFMHELYQMTRDVHGVIMEFGVRWGQTLALMANFRGMFEPYNYNKKIIGFDTFAGFPSVAQEDGQAEVVASGNYAVTEDYQAYLDAVLAFHESESPIDHIQKYELVAGDVVETVPAYFDAHPETIVALAYFDLDLYEPTVACLRALRSRITRGSVLAFDELNHPTWPGETRGLADALGISRFALKHVPFYPSAAFLVVDEMIDPT
ncbi:MAG: TylF/MycF/NovP-related O-methyltransferase [Planctomycetota bacterium]